MKLDKYEYDHLIVLQGFLKGFFDTIVDLSCTYQPTSHLFLTNIYNIICVFHEHRNSEFQNIIYPMHGKEVHALLGVVFVYIHVL